MKQKRRKCDFTCLNQLFETYLVIVSVMPNPDKLFQQECIPVGCVPPTAVSVRGVPTRHPPPGADTSPRSRHPHPGSRCPPSSRPPTPGSRHPPVNRILDTPMKILPCPKLRLRAVIISTADSYDLTFSSCQ